MLKTMRVTMASRRKLSGVYLSAIFGNILSIQFSIYFCTANRKLSIFWSCSFRTFNAWSANPDARILELMSRFNMTVGSDVD